MFGKLDIKRLYCMTSQTVTRLGYFGEVLVTKFATKVAQIFGDFLDASKNVTF